MLFVIQMVNRNNIVDLIAEKNTVRSGSYRSRLIAISDSDIHIRGFYYLPYDGLFLTILSADRCITGKEILPGVLVISVLVCDDSVYLDQRPLMLCCDIR